MSELCGSWRYSPPTTEPVFIAPERKQTCSINMLANIPARRVIEYVLSKHGQESIREVPRYELASFHRDADKNGTQCQLVSNLLIADRYQVRWSLVHLTTCAWQAALVHTSPGDKYAFFFFTSSLCRQQGTDRKQENTGWREAEEKGINRETFFMIE